MRSMRAYHRVVDRANLAAARLLALQRPAQRRPRLQPEAAAFQEAEVRPPQGARVSVAKSLARGFMVILSDYFGSEQRFFCPLRILGLG